MTQQHKRPPNEQEQNALTLVQAVPHCVALMPILFNGQERFGLVLVRQNSAGQYAQVLAIIPTSEDQVLNGAGQPGSLTPPVPQQELN